MSRARIAIVDDHALFRSGLALTVQEGLGADIVFEGDDPADLLTLEPPPDVVLLDLDLGGRTADADVAAALLERGCRVLVVSAMGSPKAVAEMIEIGVNGFVSKREHPETLVQAIEQVLSDGSWTSPEVAALIVSSARRPALSPAQERVLVLYASGMKLESVARHLGMTVGTAQTHLKRARAKYAQVGRCTSSRVDLFREASRDGLIDPQP